MGGKKAKENRSFSPGKHYELAHHMIKEVFHTYKEAVTDTEGKITVRGFKGLYSISVDGKKYNVELLKDSSRKINL
jgi:hypothetical protein